MSDHDKEFSRWLDQKGKEPMSDELANLLAEQSENDDNQVWQDRIHTANYMANQADITPEQEVPNWDRGSTFEDNASPWWQWQGLPILSTGFSIFAVMFVIFNVQFSVESDGVLLSFGGQASKGQEEKIAALVDQRLMEFASEQQVVLANYASDIKVKQQENSLQLANYIFSTARQERKEDMNELITYLVEQRKDEKLDQKIRFSELERQITQASYKQDLGQSTMKPADWAVEE